MKRINHIRNLLEPLDVVIDAGANIGRFQDRISDIGCDCHLFEPDTNAINELKKKYSNQSKLTIHENAVSDSNGTRKLYFHLNYGEDPVKMSVSSSLISTKNNVNPELFIEVKTVDLSEFVFSLDKQVRLLKMDIEGEEITVLNKLIDSKAIDKIDYIYVEMHDGISPEYTEQAKRMYKRIRDLKLTNINLDWE